MIMDTAMTGKRTYDWGSEGHIVPSSKADLVSGDDYYNIKDANLDSFDDNGDDNGDNDNFDDDDDDDDDDNDDDNDNDDDENHKGVQQLDLKSGKVVNTFSSLVTAAKCLNLGGITHILRCCDGRKAAAHGYRWMYVHDGSDSNASSDDSNLLEDHDNGIIPRIRRESQQKKMVEQISLQTGEVINLFDSITAAANKVGLSHGSISQICNGKKESINGYVFRFIDEANIDNFEENKSSLTTGSSTQSNSSEDLKRNTQQRKVVEQISLDTGKVVRVYDSITAAASKSGISHGSISQICNGKKESINGYVFRFSDPADIHRMQSEDHCVTEAHHLRKRAKVVNEQEKVHASSLWHEDREARLKREQKKMVEQISLQTGKVVNLFDSITAAANKVGLSHGSISQICNGKKESINGYVFRFIDPADIHVPNSVNQYTQASLQLGISEDEYMMIIKSEEEQAVASLVTLKFLDFSDI